MRTHELAANLALAGWSLAPLLISLNPKLNVLLTSCLTVYVACYRSVKATPPPKTMSKKRAMRFPLVRSVRLLLLFLLFKFLSKNLVNTVFTACFFVAGIEDLYATLLPLVHCFLPQGWNDSDIMWRAPYFHSLSVEFTKSQVVASVTGFFICVWYAMKKHWFAKNVLGIAFCIQGIEKLSLGSFKTGGIYLSGHVVDDVFWVFFTPVMITVAKSFDAPIKLMFPTADAARPFFMLGLGDIIIPGRFVALALRFDVSRGIKNRYFSSAFLGYASGITATIAVMKWFQAAQPALLYIVPGVTGFMAAHALWNGEVKPLLEFSESQTEKEPAGQKIKIPPEGIINLESNREVKPLKLLLEFGESQTEKEPARQTIKIMPEGSINLKSNGEMEPLLEFGEPLTETEPARQNMKITPKKKIKIPSRAKRWIRSFFRKVKTTINTRI